MRSDLRNIFRKRQGGQTLIIAMIVLGVLLVLGFVFVGMIRGNLLSTSRSRLRSVANDLAEAGIRYAHAQLVGSELGADWRGTPTAITPAAQPNFTYDPDIYYLRPGTNMPFRVGKPQLDLGGPDGLGSYIRVPSSNGRSLVRVRYAPSDANILSDSPTGALRQPGAVRSYLIIESIGREGKVSLNDPTTLAGSNPVQFRGFASTAQLQNGIGGMRQFDSQFANSRKLIAFASIGIIDHALYVTNVDNVTRPVEIGYPDDLGVMYTDTLGGATAAVDIAPKLLMQLGTPGDIKSPTTVQPQSGGSMQINGDLVIHGNLLTYLNSTLGEGISVSGIIAPASGQSSLHIMKSALNTATGQWDAVDLGTLATLNSRDAGFTTKGGLVRDGLAAIDPDGHARGIGRKIPPSIGAVDPSTKTNRYLLLTRETGSYVPGGPVGRWGHGEGVYVDNFSNKQNAIGSDHPNDGLLYDWMNPGNGGTETGWRGPYYIPRAATADLNIDGFTITRDPLSPNTEERVWTMPDGTVTSRSSLRYKIGSVSPGGGAPARQFIINELTPGIANFNGSLTPSDFLKGQPFNGVLYFEGNVRVRGVIPTDVALTLVSNATIYIDGSITKGVSGNTVTGTSGRLDRPSKSQLILMATQHVAVNTTMFTGPMSGTNVKEYSQNSASAKYSPITMGAVNDSVTLGVDFPLDWESASDPANPRTWSPYGLNYTAYGTSMKIAPRLVLTHTSGDQNGSASLISMQVNKGLANPYYLFPVETNTARAFMLPEPTVNFSMYGLGSETWQTYNEFESRAFTILDPVKTIVNDDLITMQAADQGSYQLLLQSANELLIEPANISGVATKDYLLARSVVTPADIRIEASIFAERGSFFVIAGPYFNNNPEDTREAYTAKLNAEGGPSSSSARAAADLDRQARCGVVAEKDSSGQYVGSVVPFYGEPLDVRVTIVGSVAENMPPPMSMQADYLRKWGWIPSQLGSAPVRIPSAHVPNAYANSSLMVVPNLNIQYDPALATGRVRGWTSSNNPGDPVSPLVRVDDYGRALPPMPRLPVSPALAYFGEVQ